MNTAFKDSKELQDLKKLLIEEQEKRWKDSQKSIKKDTYEEVYDPWLENYWRQF